MPSSTSHVRTTNASRYLQQLAKHWSHRFTVTFDPERADIDFGNGQRVTLRATAADLKARVSVEGQGDIGELEAVVVEHLSRFAFREELAFDWGRDANDATDPQWSKPMTRRPLGKSGLSISPLVFGGNVFGWTADRERSFELLDRFVDAGLETIDTADVYSAWVPGNSGGESETIIGDWMKARGTRNKIVLITKVGMELAPGRKGLSAAYIERAVEDSLRRLQTDRIDLYFSHVFDPYVPVEETLAAYERLIEAGKVRAIGASNHDAEQLRHALEAAKASGLPRYEALQPEYNLYDRAGYEGALRDLAQEEELGVITYFSLAAGFLTGKYRSKDDLAGRARAGMVERYLDTRGIRILDALDEVAQAHDASPAEVALAWLIAQPGVTAPIASATSASQLGSLIRATSLNLSKAEIARLNSAGKAGKNEWNS